MAWEPFVAIPWAPKKMGVIKQWITTPINNKLVTVLFIECPILRGFYPYLINVHFVT